VCGPCFVFAGFTLAFALQLRKKHGKISVGVAIYKHTMRIVVIIIIIIIIIIGGPGLFQNHSHNI
jgi:hypothetical protein